MLIKNEDIRYYEVEGEAVCIECILDDELDGIEADKVFTDVSEDFTVFCDRCKKLV